MTSVLSPAQGYALWAPSYGETAVTVLEVAVASPRLGISRTPMVLALVTLALTKAGLVAFFFMHLKQERKALRWTVLLPFALPALYAMVLVAEASWRFLR